MRTYDEVFADAGDRPPFSNMTAFEVFADNVCNYGAGCVHDGVWASGPVSAECPLITVALTQKTPKEWTERTSAEDIDRQAYVCTAYEEHVATATDDEPADANPDEGWHPTGIRNDGRTWRIVDTVVIPITDGQEPMF